MEKLISDFMFLLPRITWLTVLDILLVTAIFYVILRVLRGTQAVVLLRGFLFLIIVFGLFTSIFNLPAFSWLIGTSLPALLFAIPVIFAPEIRRGLERIGRVRIGSIFLFRSPLSVEAEEKLIDTVLTVCERLSENRYGALIVMQINDDLSEYLSSGVTMDAECSTELLLQVFYPNTPLHDGAVVIVNDRIKAAGCVMPLSDDHGIKRSSERVSGLRHRAAVGISEVSDAITLVVSEETGLISLAHQGRLIRFLSNEKLKNNILSLYSQSVQSTSSKSLSTRIKQTLDRDQQKEGK